MKPNESPAFVLIAQELEHAKKKHPHFIDTFTGWDADYSEQTLRANRSALAGAAERRETTFGDVLHCEILEAIDAYAHGDLGHAREELAQCAAVCIRGIEFVEAEMDNFDAVKAREENAGLKERVAELECERDRLREANERLQLALGEAEASAECNLAPEIDRLRDLVRRMMPAVEEAFVTAKAIGESVCDIFDMKDVDASEVDSVLRQWEALIAEARKVVKEDKP